MAENDIRADLVVVGGGLGGIAAALAALELGLRVVMTAPGEWLGGQLTAQGVPPDEPRWIEEIAPTSSYARMRELTRRAYLEDYPLAADVRAAAHLNPGAARVSRICAEPRVSAQVIERMLSPHLADGTLTVLRHRVPVAVDRAGDTLTAVTVRDTRDGRETCLPGRYFADATELGDLLPLAEVAHVIGAEARGETGELHAPEIADPLDQQAVTWCAALEFDPDGEHVIDRPAGYEAWRTRRAPFWPGPQLSWRALNVRTLDPVDMPLFPTPGSELDLWQDTDLWRYRRVLASESFDRGWRGNEVTIVNWPHNDYWDEPLLDAHGTYDDAAAERARGLTLALVHWMQTEAPRHDGGVGYPELRLRGDVLGTDDGLAQEPYIRESRRIRALFTVTEEHIGEEMRGGGAGAAVFADTVGIGSYRIDLHPSTAGRSYVDIGCFPFQIPLGALLPADTGNLLAANKNIGTTHISNGAYRLHPVEWSIGVAVGAVAALCIAERRLPRDLLADEALLETLQQQVLARRLGVELEWPERLRALDG
ncbi:FAD-dependent oxidoreductase [Agromyces sp. SYSU T00194]|uniref:FAD-dependent oxidoreductase n=1 Tax=Agromyces chitinivorans TaxID=3158560 RepID=UPI00339933A4